MFASELWLQRSYGCQGARVAKDLWLPGSEGCQSLKVARVARKSELEGGWEGCRELGCHIATVSRERGLQGCEVISIVMLQGLPAFPSWRDCQGCEFARVCEVLRVVWAARGARVA